MQPIYERIDWENYPSKKTAVNEDNLNKMDYALSEIDKRVVNLAGYEERVKISEENTQMSEINASTKSQEAENSATLAKSYAVGGTGTRENEEIENAKYYYEQAERIAKGLSGTLLPCGTITFEELADVQALPGYMYNISNDFVSDDRFIHSGISHGVGANIYMTIDGKWDVLAGSNVLSVNGKTGTVILNADDVGAVAKGGDVADNTVTYTEVTELEELTSCEKLSAAFGKIKLAVKNVISIVKLLGSTDISKIEDGTVTGILSALNTNFTKLSNFEVFYPIANATIINSGLASHAIGYKIGKFAIIKADFALAYFDATKPLFLVSDDAYKPKVNTNAHIRCWRDTRTDVGTSDYIGGNCYIDTDGNIWQKFNSDGNTSSWTGNIFVCYEIA